MTIEFQKKGNGQFGRFPFFEIGLLLLNFFYKSSNGLYQVWSKR